MTTVPDDQPCPHCGRWKTRGVTVDALLIWQGEILLMERAEEPYQGHLALPGGWLETDHPSTAYTAALELLQETGVRGINPKRVGVFDNPQRHPEQAISIAYAFEPDGRPEPRIGDPKEVRSVGFYPLNDLPDNLAFDHATIIAAYMTAQ